MDNDLLSITERTKGKDQKSRSGPSRTTTGQKMGEGNYIVGTGYRGRIPFPPFPYGTTIPESKRKKMNSEGKTGEKKRRK